MPEITFYTAWHHVLNYATVQEAIDAAVAEGPSRLYFPPGVYDVEGLVVNGGDLEIYGPQATLRLAPGSGVHPDNTGVMLSVLDPERFVLNVGAVDANLSATTATGHSLIHVYAAEDGSTREVTYHVTTTISKPEIQRTVFIRSRNMLKAGAALVRVSGDFYHSGSHNCVHVRGAHKRVELDRIFYTDPNETNDGHAFDVTAEAAIDGDAVDELVVRDWRQEYTASGLFVQNVRHTRIDGFLTQHQGKNGNGDPTDNLGQPIKVDHYWYRPDYTFEIRGLVTRDSDPAQAFSAIWLAEGCRNAVVIEPDVDRDIRLGATALQNDHDGRDNHLVGGRLRNNARVLLAEGCTVDGTRFTRDDGGTNVTVAIQGAANSEVRNVHLSGYRSIWPAKADPGTRLVNVTMDATCEVYNARNAGDPVEIVMQGCRGGKLNLQPWNNVDAALRLDIQDCGVEIAAGLRAKLENNATLLAKDNFRWNGTAFEQVINDSHP